MFPCHSTGLADVNAADRKAARAAVRPQLINTLAKAGELRWTDDINPSPKNKQYKRVLDMHKDMLGELAVHECCKLFLCLGSAAYNQRYCDNSA